MSLRRDAMFWLLAGIAATSAANAVWMLAGHAALLVFDTLRGFLDGDPWLLDLPGVYLPALLLTPIAVRLLRRSRGEAPV